MTLQHSDESVNHFLTEQTDWNENYHGRAFIDNCRMAVENGNKTCHSKFEPASPLDKTTTTVPQIQLGDLIAFITIVSMQ